MVVLQFNDPSNGQYSSVLLDGQRFIVPRGGEHLILSLPSPALQKPLSIHTLRRSRGSTGLAIASLHKRFDGEL
jgi:hypothetical protein